MSLNSAPSSATRRKSRRPGPALAVKTQPAQRRATETFERILEVGAQTLADVGIDRLSTNLVCERAGLSPPALYRYFPNKYALLCELGRRLMERQNEVVPRWISLEVLAGPRAGLERALQGLLLDTYRVTRETTAGVWITRALRAVPALAEVRLASHHQVTQAQVELLKLAYPGAELEELRLLSRVTVELIYAATELLFEESPLSGQAVARLVGAMVASYRGRLRGERGKKGERKGGEAGRQSRSTARAGHKATGSGK
jgi:AcrR family transcriptional regulator